MKSQANRNIIVFNTVYAYFTPVRSCGRDINLILQWPRVWLGDIIRSKEDWRNSLKCLSKVVLIS